MASGRQGRSGSPCHATRYLHTCGIAPFLPLCPQHEVIPPMCILSASAPLKSASKRFFLGFAWPRGSFRLWREFASSVEGVPLHCQEHAICICGRLPLPSLLLPVAWHLIHLPTLPRSTCAPGLRQITRFWVSRGRAPMDGAAARATQRAIYTHVGLPIPTPLPSA